MASSKNPPLPQPLWENETVILKDFLMSKDVPHVSKVVKGQFMNIGTSKFNPLKKLHQDVLVHSIKTGLKVLGHSVARVDSRDGRTHRLVALEQRLSIPVTYKGWFELLSEDGRSVRPIETVLQLAKLFPKVKSVLVRQNVKACLLNETDGVCDKSRVVTAGEQLTLTADVSRNLPTETGQKVRLLKCTDTKGESLYLRLDQKGSFMPIASENDVMGVFRIKDVIERFRLPLTLKLVQGVWPKVDSSRFTGMVRLDWAYTDETAFVCPIESKIAPRIYPIPTEVSLRLAAASNNNDLLEHEALSTIMTKCNRLVANYHNTIHLIISVPEGAVKAKSHTMANLYSQTNQAVTPLARPTSQMRRTKSREDILHDQLDDLYGYLQMGKQPPAAKFARDSDEETYYEEPEFEPMTKFRDRLAMLDRGDLAGSQNNASYNFVDPRAKLDANHNVVTQTRTNGHLQVIKPASASPVPPELPPRLYKDKRSESAPFVTYINSVTGSQGSGSGKVVTNSWTLTRTMSKDSASPSQKSKTSRDSSGSVEYRQSSSGSKENRSSHNSSAKPFKARRSVPLLYL